MEQSKERPVFTEHPPMTKIIRTEAISLIAGFVVAYALNAVISRIPFFRWAVLGIKKERKNDVS